VIERRRSAASALSCALLLVAAAPRSVVLLDPSLSPYAATVSLGAAADAVYALQDRYVPIRVGDEDGIPEKVGGIGYRLVRLTLVDAPVVGLHSVVRHEVAGHGGRIRQLGGDVRGYIEDARSLGIREGHDVENYVGLVNASAPANAPGEPITVDALQEASSVELVNPGFYYALYAVFGRYLVAGERRAPVPALGIGAFRVMPTLHLRLTPFGREYAPGLVAGWGERVLRAVVRIGDGPRGTFSGLELRGRRLYTGPRFRAGARVGLWRQFDIGGGSPDPEVGGLAVVRGAATVPSLPVSPVVELGAKTRGYAPGEALSAGPIVRLGAALRF